MCYAGWTCWIGRRCGHCPNTVRKALLRNVETFADLEEHLFWTLNISTENIFQKMHTFLEMPLFHNMHLFECFVSISLDIKSQNCVYDSTYRNAQEQNYCCYNRYHNYYFYFFWLMIDCDSGHHFIVRDDSFWNIWCHDDTLNHSNWTIKCLKTAWDRNSCMKTDVHCRAKKWHA